MKDYEIVVGLEVHAELNTKSKIYCNCRNAFGLEVNTQVCPVCMGMPGTLPTLNEKVVEYAIKMGHAMHCQINGVCKQDRKNYFYPDLPKAYQISQAEVPLCGKGYLDVMVDGQMKRIGVTRIHIEEDAGKLLHDESFSGSLVDLNRCGLRPVCRFLRLVPCGFSLRDVSGHFSAYDLPRPPAFGGLQFADLM